ncbi:phosphoribosyl-AMP cyclohydrolase [Vallitalea okinawensis]|uniref:phosphoribosyl-AMP cyclohydrolase n=1 Tax=Vallitalea okinawensis TaxID=2078660 RepID=UPI001A9A3A0D|nr:phosphoribosyl-AMP cyclohydrolase [Vallitalea okinawensis]
MDFKDLKLLENQLIPVIVQQFDTKEVLMQAYMNDEAYAKTISTGDLYFFSRSRKGLWKKGETSGHTQDLIELLIDCDNDCLLALIDQVGPACHTNHRTCFYRKVDIYK